MKKETLCGLIWNMKKKGVVQFCFTDVNKVPNTSAEILKFINF